MMVRAVRLERAAHRRCDPVRVRSTHRSPSGCPNQRQGPAFRVGSDLGINPGNFDFAVAADFDDVDGYLAYRDHPEHRAMISQFVLPVAAQRAAVQYEF
jgi:hypothetical protein